MKQRQLLGLFTAFALTLYSINTALAAPLSEQSSPYYGPIKSGETLWKIARQIRPAETNLSYYQVMLALLKANPASFKVACNLNTLKVGSTLFIPSKEEMLANSHSEASQAFSRQVEEWEMFTKHGVAIECDAAKATTNETPETPELQPSNNKPPTLNNNNATAHETTSADAKLTTHTSTTPLPTLPTENALSTTDTPPAAPLPPPTDFAMTGDSTPTPPSTAKLDAKPSEAQKPNPSMSSQAFTQLLSTAFWQALLHGNTPQPGSTVLLLLLVSLLIIGLLSFWLYNRSCKVFLQQAIYTSEKEQIALEKAALEADSELVTAIVAEEQNDKDDIIQPASVIAERPFGWFLAVIVPLSLYFGMQHQPDLNENSIIFIAIISVPLIMWMFSLLPDFVPALFAVLLCLLFGLAPAEIVLSGFSSSGFLLTFSVLGLGVVITSSGLTYRYSLLLLKWLPQHTIWYQLALFFTGILFTPVVPSIAGRAAITAPILRNLTKDLDAKTKTRAGSMLYSSGLDGISFVSAVFLTSAPANLIIFGMLPPQEQQAFQFMYWLYAASLTGGIMLLLYLIISSLYFFSAYRHVHVSKQNINKELQQMGNMSWREWWALAGIIILAIGIMTASVHKIKIPFVAFTVFFVLLFLGVLTRDEFIKKIDWAFLFLLGCLIGVVATMSYLEIDQILLVELSVLGDYMRHDFEVFILLLSIAILLVRFFIPINSTILIFTTALMPLANASGVSPWLVGFIILLMAETSFFNYQSPHILYFRRAGQGDLKFNEWSITIFRVLLVIAKLVAIYASIPFWLNIGVL